MNKCTRLLWTEYVAKMDKSRSALKMLTGKTRGKRHLGRTKYTWEDNIRLDIKI